MRDAPEAFGRARRAAQRGVLQVLNLLVRRTPHQTCNGVVHMMTQFRTALLAAVTALFTGAASADLPAPSGEVVLSVSGAITITNAEGQAVFDREMLEAFDPAAFATTTIWTEGLHTFVGVPLVDLLEAVGAEGSLLRASAINDYTVEIPLGDAVAGGPIVAYLMDDRPMSVREKGPLWVIYPFDDVPAYQSETIYSRSIWQLNRIEVVR